MIVRCFNQQNRGCNVRKFLQLSSGTIYKPLWLHVASIDLCPGNPLYATTTATTPSRTWGGHGIAIYRHCIFP